MQAQFEYLCCPKLPVLGEEEEDELSPQDSFLLLPRSWGVLLLGVPGGKGWCCAGHAAEPASEPERHVWHWQEKTATAVN